MKLINEQWYIITLTVLQLPYIQGVYAGYEVLTAVIMKGPLFWDTMPCSTLKVNQHFRGICFLNLQGQRISQSWNHHEARSKDSLLPAGGDMLLRNVGWLSTDYMMLYPKRWNFSPNVYSWDYSKFSIGKQNVAVFIWIMNTGANIWHQAQR
jgi:hypothetical protein